MFVIIIMLQCYVKTDKLAIYYIHIAMLVLLTFLHFVMGLRQHGTS